jgi:HK97 family phage major capsid protein
MARGLKDQRDTLVKDATAIRDAAKAEERDLTDEELSEIEAKMNEVDDLDVKIVRGQRGKSALDRLATIVHPEEDEQRERANQPKSLGDFFVAHAGERLKEIKGAGGKWSVGTPEYVKAATDVQVTPASGAGLAPLVTDFDRAIVTGVRRRLTIADLLGSGRISGNALTYFVEGAAEGDFTTVAENSQKPQIHFVDPTPVTESLKKIAAFVKESDEMVDDFPFLVDTINERLLYMLGLFEENQLLNGNGTGTNLRGLLQRVGIQTLGVVGDPKTGNLDQIFKAITATDTGSGLSADGIVINPTDYQTFRLLKDSAGQYLGGGPFTGQYGNGGILTQPPLWGLPTVITPAIAAGTVLVGNFRLSSTVYRKGGVRVDSTNSEGNDFTNNRITIRAEERLLLAVRIPAALVKVTLGTV